MGLPFKYKSDLRWLVYNFIIFVYNIIKRVKKYFFVIKRNKIWDCVISSEILFAICISGTFNFIGCLYVESRKYREKEEETDRAFANGWFIKCGGFYYLCTELL